MKKITGLILSAAMALSLTTAHVRADDEVKIMYNGEVIQCEVPPEIRNGCTSVPAQEFFEKLGITVDYNDIYRMDRITAESDDKLVCMIFNQHYVTVSPKSTKIATVTRIPSERALYTSRINDKIYTFAPLRAMAEALGFDVEWDDETKTITLSEAKGFELSTDCNGYTNIAAKTIPIMVSVVNGDPDDTYTFEWSCDEGTFEGIYIDNAHVWREPDKSAIYTETAIWEADLEYYFENYVEDEPVLTKAYVTVTNSKGMSVTEEFDLAVTKTFGGSQP